MVLSDAGALNLWHELAMKRKELEKLADVAYHPKDIAATIASTVPDRGHGDRALLDEDPRGGGAAHADLIARAADVVLEAPPAGAGAARDPLNLAHLRNMTAVTEMGGIVFPPVPAFYAKPKSLDELVAHSVARVLDLFGVPPLSSPAGGDGKELRRSD